MVQVYLASEYSGVRSEAQKNSQQAVLRNFSSTLLSPFSFNG